MPSYYTFTKPCISRLCASGHTCLIQPTQLELIFGDNLSMANLWQQWCWKRQNIRTQGQQILLLQEKHVFSRMLLCKSHCEVWHCMSLQEDPDRCSSIELALEDRDRPAELVQVGVKRLSYVKLCCSIKVVLYLHFLAVSLLLRESSIGRTALCYD